MTWNLWYRIAGLLAVAACLWPIPGAGFASANVVSTHLDEQQTEAQTAPAAPEQNQLIIQNDSELPDTYPRANYQVRLFAVGGVPVLHWQLERGALPPGIKLEDDGLLHGAAERNGEFQFTASVRDSGKPQQAVEKQFLIRVRAAFSLNWKS